MTTTAQTACPPSAVADQIIHVTGCDIDWTGPRRAWDNWFSDCHARRHRKGQNGLSACCPGLTITPRAAVKAGEEGTR